MTGGYHDVNVSLTLYMAGRQLLVVGPTMMESPVTWRMITPAWSTGVPTMSNFGMLVPVTHPMTGPVSMEI